MKQENVFVPRTSAEHLRSCVTPVEILLRIKREVLALHCVPLKMMSKSMSTRKYLLVGLANQEGLVLPKWKRKNIHVSAEPSSTFCNNDVPSCHRAQVSLGAHSKIYHARPYEADALGPADPQMG